ncbi:hypothetical protein MAPG_10662 [Magnaporthiopsis poae ATCC 64411]|uniref:Uncharacterized protein n=1 Tax=Magnaporthiopsis poae (strain ATCC 64411 / 73-15) TaxID=644358 RepID=A0A0C4ED69_MAGP6|nr:hypothetical protein MAPG_10662 [Magnaporthiopsis poae ATCC 64411]
MSAVVPRPTYVLAPSWDHPFDGGRIALGNIIVDPFKPHISVTKLSASDGAQPPPSHSISQTDWELETDRIRGSNLTFWTQVANVLKLSTGPKATSSDRIKFAMSELQTVSFGDEPSREYMAARASHPAVRRILERTSWWGRPTPVYMVSGVKVAHGFRHTRMTSSARGVSVTAGTPSTPGTTAVGADVQLNAESRLNHQTAATVPIVFAYQLLRIRLKASFKGEELEVKENESSSAFLGSAGDQDRAVRPEALDFEEVGLETLTGLVQEYELDTQILDKSQQEWMFQNSLG